MKQKIPIPYQVINEVLRMKSWKGRLQLGMARTILGRYFHMPHQRITSIFAEMKELGLIEFEVPVSSRYIIMVGV